MQKYQELVQYKKEELKNNFLFFLSIKRMSEKALKFNNIRLNKKEFHKSKQSIDLKSVNVDQIVVSDKFRPKALIILLVTKKMKLLNRYVLSHLK